MFLLAVLFVDCLTVTLHEQPSAEKAITFNFKMEHLKFFLYQLHAVLNHFISSSCCAKCEAYKRNADLTNYNLGITEPQQ